jgi:hypothetical protein
MTSRIIPSRFELEECYDCTSASCDTERRVEKLTAVERGARMVIVQKFKKGRRVKKCDEHMALT